MDMNRISDLVKEGKLAEIDGAVKEALDAGVEAMTILEEGLVSPINELGVKFRDGEIFVPELLMASKCMKQGVAVLKPYLVEGNVKKAGKIVFCTVAGDMHDIGKNLVVLMLESAGFEVIDLGMDVDIDDIIECLEENPDVQILGMSAMLTTTMYEMQENIEVLEEEGLRDRIKIMVGGAPVTQAFADKIGADGYSPNAPMAVELAKRLVLC